MTLSDKAAKKLSSKESEGAVPWQAPKVSEAVSASAITHLPTARELEALQKEAHDEAFAQGLEEGRQEGAREARKDLLAAHRREALRLEAFLDALGQPLAEVTAMVEKEILALVVAMARQVIRRELKTSPDEIVGTVRDALGQLPVAHREVQVELHPEDAALVRDRLQDRQQGTKRWSIVEDPLIARGGCRVKSDDSLIDATLDSRIGALVSRVFGEQRSEEAARKEAGDASPAVT